ncbi:hypothetical protein [Ensifer adhaerens]|uniref:hypothetical protein n=1 Tax=Ensifer adhaerens TaxID=106592 RepID=UPI001F3109E9|nr:hypothetical protein [Ensifer adhaerens]MDF8356526.1 hypothetical protein [Ensifer adhaerens]
MALAVSADIVSAHLVNTVLHFEQSIVHVELGVAPQARIDSIRRRLVVCDEGLVLLKVPDNISVRFLYGQLFWLGDEALLAFSKSSLLLKSSESCTALLAAFVASVAGFVAAGCCVCNAGIAISAVQAAADKRRRYLLAVMANLGLNHVCNLAWRIPDRQLR